MTELEQIKYVSKKFNDIDSIFGIDAENSFTWH